MTTVVPGRRPPVQRPAPGEAPGPVQPDPDDAAAESWALIERAQAGDCEAFGLFYRRYADMVFRFVYFRVGDRQLAEDLTGDTFLRAFSRIGSFTWQGRDPMALLGTIARNLVLDHFKSARYRTEVAGGLAIGDAVRDADDGLFPDPQRAACDYLVSRVVVTALLELGDRNAQQYECLVLRYFDGLSIAETAAVMDKPEGAVKALQFRATQALARLLPKGLDVGVLG